MRPALAFALLAILVAALIFLWGTSGVASISRRSAAEQDSTRSKRAVNVDTVAVAPGGPRTKASPGLEVPVPDAASGLIIPVAGIRPDQIVDTYNAARAEGRTHNAIDIIAPKGAHVLAAADGSIARLFLSKYGGKTIYQTSQDRDTVYYYAHLDAYADGLKQGQTVRQGEVIGFVGDTGDAAPGNYHLHFAIWTTDDTTNFWDGRNINPYPLLRGKR